MKTKPRHIIIHRTYANRMFKYMGFTTYHKWSHEKMQAMLETIKDHSEVMNYTGPEIPVDVRDAIIAFQAPWSLITLHPHKNRVLLVGYLPATPK